MTHDAFNERLLASFGLEPTSCTKLSCSQRERAGMRPSISDALEPSSVHRDCDTRFPHEHVPN